MRIERLPPGDDDPRPKDGQAPEIEKPTGPIYWDPNVFPYPEESVDPATGPVPGGIYYMEEYQQPAMVHTYDMFYTDDTKTTVEVRNIVVILQDRRRIEHVHYSKLKPTVKPNQ